TYVLRGHLRGEVFYRGRPASYWRQALRSQDPAVSAEAVRQLHDGGQSAVPVLVALLKGNAASGWGAAEARWKAADLLGQLGPEARDAVGPLVEALGDEDLHVRAVAAASLGAVTPREAAQEAVPGLTALLATGGPACTAAAKALSRFGPEAE